MLLQFSFTDCNNVLAQGFRDDAAFLAAFQPLRSCSAATWCFFVARITVFAHRAKIRCRMIRPYVSRFHSCVTILAICHRVLWQSLHPYHLSHTAARVFDEPAARLQFAYQLQYVLIYCVAELCVFAHRVKVARFRVLPSMMTDGCDAVCRAVRACPNHIRLAELCKDVSSSHCQHICIQVDVFELLVPLNRKHFMPVRFKRLSDASRACEQFQNFDCINPFRSGLGSCNGAVIPGVTTSNDKHQPHQQADHSPAECDRSGLPGSFHPALLAHFAAMQAPEVPGAMPWRVHHFQHPFLLGRRMRSSMFFRIQCSCSAVNGTLSRNSCSRCAYSARFASS